MSGRRRRVDWGLVIGVAGLVLAFLSYRELRRHERTTVPV